MPRLGDIYDAPWGRYRVHRVLEAGVVLVDTKNATAFLQVTSDKLAWDYILDVAATTPPAPSSKFPPPTPEPIYDPRAPLPEVTPPTPEPERPRSIAELLAADRVTYRAVVSAPLLTLGAVRPSRTIISLPHVETLYWLPCATLSPLPAEPGELAQPHLFYIASFRCPTCRGAAVPAPAPAQEGSPQTGREAHVANTPSSPSAFDREQVPVTEEVSPPVPVVPPAPTRVPSPPWEGDARGAIWTWSWFGGRAQATLREVYEERAAIMEYDGRMERPLAEYLAYRCVLDQATAAGLVPQGATA